MSKADLERLVRDIQTSPRLLSALEGKVAFSEIVSVCRTHGYDISTDDLRAYAHAQSPELNDEQLDAISAGTTLLNAEVPSSPQLSAGGSIPLFGAGGIVPLVGRSISSVPLVGFSDK
jgi:predicted ribosomally synthesized peptide with nif11-like leader